MEPIIRLRQISKIFGKGENQVKALKDINLDVHSGDFLSIMGPSGGGKTTLLNIMGCLDTPTNGSYELLQRSVPFNNDKALATFRSKAVTLVFQSFALMEGYSVKDNVVLPLLKQKISRPERIKRVDEALDQLGIKHLRSKNVNLLSGGQKQRVAIARSIAARTKILLADEPTGSLDSKNSESLMMVLQELNRLGKTIVLITHDPKIDRYAQRSLRIIDGNLHE